MSNTMYFIDVNLLPNKLYRFIQIIQTFGLYTLFFNKLSDLTSFDIL